PWSGLEGDRAGFNVPSEDYAAIAGVIERFADMSAADRASWRQAARERAQRQADDQATFEAWREWLTGDLSRPAREPNRQS
ncbi:MAG: glycosyltransferase, partial [Tsuneonella sp.]